jgi:hypothetical protein
MEYPDVDLQLIENTTPRLIDGLQGPDHAECHLRKRPIREHLRPGGGGRRSQPDSRGASATRTFAASLGCPLKRCSSTGSSALCSRLDDLATSQTVPGLQSFANVTLALLHPRNPFPERTPKGLSEAGINSPDGRYRLQEHPEANRTECLKKQNSRVSSRWCFHI